MPIAAPIGGRKIINSSVINNNFTLQHTTPNQYSFCCLPCDKNQRLKAAWILNEVTSYRLNVCNTTHVLWFHSVDFNKRATERNINIKIKMKIKMKIKVIINENKIKIRNKKKKSRKRTFSCHTVTCQQTFNYNNNNNKIIIWLYLWQFVNEIQRTRTIISSHKM